MSRLGVIGSSFGGMVAVAAQDKRIKAMVCLSTPYYLPHISRGAGRISKKGFYEDLRTYRLLEAVRNAPPILILHGNPKDWR